MSEIAAPSWTTVASIGREQPPSLSIGQVADLAGVPITTLRYYERIGLLEAPRREGGKRRYEPSVMLRLMLIKFCRIAGLGLDEIAEVIGDTTPGRRRTKEIASRRVDAIDERIAELRLARAMMEAAGRCTCASPDDCSCGALAPVIAQVRARADR